MPWLPLHLPRRLHVRPGGGRQRPLQARQGDPLVLQEPRGPPVENLLERVRRRPGDRHRLPGVGLLQGLHSDLPAVLGSSVVWQGGVYDVFEHRVDQGAHQQGVEAGRGLERVRGRLDPQDAAEEGLPRAGSEPFEGGDPEGGVPRVARIVGAGRTDEPEVGPQSLEAPPALWCGEVRVDLVEDAAVSGGEVDPGAVGPPAPGSPEQHRGHGRVVSVRSSRRAIASSRSKACRSPARPAAAACSAAGRRVAGGGAGEAASPAGSSRSIRSTSGERGLGWPSAVVLCHDRVTSGAAATSWAKRWRSSSNPRRLTGRSGSTWRTKAGAGRRPAAGPRGSAAGRPPG